MLPHAESFYVENKEINVLYQCRICKKTQIIKNLLSTAFHTFIKFLQTQQLTKLSDF